MRYDAEIVIACPVTRVFEYMDDVAREKEWQPSLLEAVKEPEGPTAVGTRKRYVSQFMGRRIANTYVTTRFDPNERVGYETAPSSALRAKVDLRFEVRGAGTRIVMAVDAQPTGLLKLIPENVLVGVARKELKSSLALLKERLEEGD